MNNNFNNEGEKKKWKVAEEQVVKDAEGFYANEKLWN